MIKSNYIFILILNYPILINSIIIIIIITSHKNNKYHPIILLIILILLTILISLKINIIFKSWTNFILFLIIIGGLIVIYIYITRLINNKNLYINLKNFLIISLKLILIILILILILNILSNNNLYFNSQEIFSFNYNIFEKKNELIISELYYYNKYSIIFIILYLYYSIICIINICYKTKKPIRQLYLYE